MWSETARKTAKIESERNKNVLREEGLLDIQRAVRVVASPYVTGARVGEGQKVLHLIRHGQGFHNLLADIWADFGREVDPLARGADAALLNPYNRPEVVDPPLTGIGREQAAALQPLTKGLSGLELVVVSPMRRAAETALIAFDHLLTPAARNEEPKVKFLGHEDVAERSHANVCDKRRRLPEIKRDFPAVDWSLIVWEEDPRFHETEAEPWRVTSDRAHRFLLWVRDRPEREIAVATHSAWLFAMLNTAMQCTDPALAEWFMTGELRSIVVSYSDQADESKL